MRPSRFSPTRSATPACGRQRRSGRSSSPPSASCPSTRASTAKPWVREPLVGALSALGVLAGAAIAQGGLAPPALALWAALAAAAFSVAGTAVARGSADLLVFAGVMVGSAAAMLVSGTALAIGIAAAAALAARPSFAGALLTGLPLMYGALAVGL